MSKTKELIDSLKSTMKEKIGTLESVQVQGVDVFNELNAARESGDDGRVSEVSEKFETIGNEIKSAREAVEEIQEQINLFTEFAYNDAQETAENLKSTNKDDLLEIFDKVAGDKASAKTVGTFFADLIKHRGITRVQDIIDLNADTRLTAFLGDTAEYRDSRQSMKSIKSIYTNHGVALDDGGEPVPGFMGVQCGLVEDRNVYCLLDPPADDFEECITRETLNGNRIRFNREVARDNQAAAVLESVYHPNYPTLEQDGTKPEGSFTIASVEVNDSKIAEFIVASDEVLADCSFVASMIDHVLVSNLNAEKRRQLIAGTGLNGEMRGILSQPDVLVRTHQDVADGGLASDNIYDTFRRGLTDIWLQNGSTENVCAILHPRDLEIIDLTKDEFGRYLFNDTECFNRMLRCLQLRTSVDIPEGTAMVGNFANNWVFYLRKALEIRMGYTGDQFITNTNTILGEMRGLSILRCPRKVVKIDGLSGVESS